MPCYQCFILFAFQTGITKFNDMIYFFFGAIKYFIAICFSTSLIWFLFCFFFWKSICRAKRFTRNGFIATYLNLDGILPPNCWCFAEYKRNHLWRIFGPPIVQCMSVPQHRVRYSIDGVFFICITKIKNPNWNLKLHIEWRRCIILFLVLQVRLFTGISVWFRGSIYI